MPDSTATSSTAVGSRAARRDMPRSVVIAIYLLWLKCALGFVYGAFFVPQGVGLTWVLVVSGAVIVAFILLLSAGHGWVRHLWVGVYLATTALAIIRYDAARLFSPTAWTISLLNVTCTAVGLLLLYFPTSRAWFSDARLRRRSGL